MLKHWHPLLGIVAVLKIHPILDGVGTALLVFARRRSVALGYEGRVGLHSLPTSEGFYEHRNMTDYGQDPDKEDLRYFEYGRLLQPLED